jgi:hypothetical protein
MRKNWAISEIPRDGFFTYSVDKIVGKRQWTQANY